MIKRLIMCSLLLTYIFIAKPQPETYCGFPTEEKHDEVVYWMRHHGIMDCYQDHDGKYYFVRRGQRINLIEGGDYGE